MKTDFTVAEEMHRRTNQSSIDSERNRAGSLVSWIQSIVDSRFVESARKSHAEQVSLDVYAWIWWGCIHEKETAKRFQFKAKASSYQVSCKGLKSHYKTENVQLYNQFQTVSWSSQQRSCPISNYKLREGTLRQSFHNFKPEKPTLNRQPLIWKRSARGQRITTRTNRRLSRR